MIRLGGPVDNFSSPEEWVAMHKRLGYTAAYCPVGNDAPESQKDEYIHAAVENDIMIAEVGAWSNLLAQDEKEAEAAFDLNVRSLALADAMGARCCVNISGSLGAKWDGPHSLHYSPHTFDRIVGIIRKIIAEVKPVRAKYTLETMQWAVPYSPENYRDILLAVDDDAFAVHLDPVNLVNSPEIYYKNGEMIKRCFELFGNKIRSCHAKDVTLDEKKPLVHLSETVIGTGGLDYAVFLRELSKLDDVPLMLEHLQTQQQYHQAAAALRAYALDEGIVI